MKTWEQVIAEKDRYIGGEFQSTEYGFMYKGPIVDIRCENNIVLLVCEWVATYDDKLGRWKYFPDHWSAPNFDSRLYLPREVNNCIFSTLPHGYCTLFPNFYPHTLTPDRVLNFPS